MTVFMTQEFSDRITTAINEELNNRLAEFVTKIGHHFGINEDEIWTVCHGELPFHSKKNKYSKMTVKELRKESSLVGLKYFNLPKNKLIENLLNYNPSDQTSEIHVETTEKNYETFTKKNLIGECKKLGIKIKCNDTKPNILKALKEFHENLDTNEERSVENMSSNGDTVYSRVDDIVPISFDTVESTVESEQETNVNEVESEQEANVNEVESVSLSSSVSETVRNDVNFNDPTEYLNNVQLLLEKPTTVVKELNKKIEINRKKKEMKMNIFKMEKKELYKMCRTHGIETDGVRDKDLKTVLQKKMDENLLDYELSNRSVLDSPS